MKLGFIVLSSLFGALGPFFNKLATFDPTKLPSLIIAQLGLPRFTIYIYTTLCWILMLMCNTLSVKYKILSYKFAGAFIGTTLIFTLMYVFSSLLGFAIGDHNVELRRYVGALMLICGINLISISEREASKERKVNSVAEVVELSFAKSPEKSLPGSEVKKFNFETQEVGISPTAFSTKLETKPVHPEDIIITTVGSLTGNKLITFGSAKSIPDLKTISKDLKVMFQANNEQHEPEEELEKGEVSVNCDRTTADTDDLNKVDADKQ